MIAARHSSGKVRFGIPSCPRMSIPHARTRKSSDVTRGLLEGFASPKVLKRTHGRPIPEAVAMAPVGGCRNEVGDRSCVLRKKHPTTRTELPDELFIRIGI